MIKFLKSIVVENGTNSAKLLHSFLAKFCLPVSIEGVAHSLNDARKIIDKVKPDLVFLDLYSENPYKFELFENIVVFDFQIIFTTSFKVLALKARKFNSIDCLLKYLNIDELMNTLDEAYKIIAKNQELKLVNKLKHKLNNEKKLIISSQKEILLLKEEDIVSLSANGKYTICTFASREEVVSTKNIGEYEKYLESPTFFRIHKSHIINLNHLEKISKTRGDYCNLSNGKILPIAKRRKESLKKLLNF